MEERIKIIKRIIDELGVNNFAIMTSLRQGDNLADFLKNYTLIYPIEYDGFLQAKTGNIGELSDSLAHITSTIRYKQHCYNLYRDYCQYFLGSLVSYVGLDYEKYVEWEHLDLRDENGKIDYAPYLKALGVGNIDDLNSNLNGFPR